MDTHRIVATVLIVQVTASFTLVVIWIQQTEPPPELRVGALFCLLVSSETINSVKIPLGTLGNALPIT
jgi:hypothetical protein